MATPGRTQKQIAERYKGNLGYYKRKHPWRVARFTVSFLALAGGLAAIIAYQDRIFRRQASEEFFSSGRLSSQHAKFEQDCAACHDKNAPVGTAKKYDLHEPNVVENRSCAICHQEHLGPGPLKRVADLQCASCHNDSAIMDASAKKGATLPPDAFHLRSHPPQQIVFELTRPARGYTQVFPSF